MKQESPDATTDPARFKEFTLRAIRDLDRLADAHSLWLNGYHRALFCGDGHPAEVTAPDAHDRCAFGVWYRELELDHCKPWAVHLQRVDRLHRRLHESAAELAEHATTEAVSGDVYDRFADDAHRFKSGMRALQMRLVREVCLVDHLTGVWNRSSLIPRLGEECDRLLRYGGTGCLCMMDIDHFKIVNDRHGHAVGDRVLKRVAETAQRRLRRFDAIFRYGGEEFLICLPRASVAEAEASMERVRADIAEAVTRTDDGCDIRVTASFGVSALRPERAVEDCIEAADQALFMAKATGRNRVCSF